MKGVNIMANKRRYLVFVLVLVLVTVTAGTALAGTSAGLRAWRAFPLTYEGRGNYLDVMAIQNHLSYYSYETRNEIDKSGGIDGYFGSGTKRAVTKFQSEQRLDADGKVGPNTWGAMYNWLQGPYNFGDGYDYYANLADSCCRTMIFSQNRATSAWRTLNRNSIWVTFQ